MHAGSKTSDAESHLSDLAAQYRAIYCWDATAKGTLLSVTMSGAFTGVIVPPSLLQRLWYRIGKWGDPCPTVHLPGETPLAVVLTDAREYLPGAEALPVGVRVLPALGSLLLPPSATTHGSVRWLRAPQAERRWLPATASIISVARMLSGVPRRGQVRSPKVEPRDLSLMRRTAR